MKVAFTHRRINNGLTVVVVVIGAYIALAPFLPAFQLWIKTIFDGTDGYKYQSVLADDSGKDFGDLEAPPTENTLLIPEIYLDEKVVEGGDISVIYEGSVWRRPQSSTPDKGGNTVIVGHRWSYSDPATFYHLDKLEPGDKFSLFWNQKEYVYEVFEKITVTPTSTGIEAQTEEPIVTLYTCAPLWTATQRLVVKANLIISPEESNE